MSKNSTGAPLRKKAVTLGFIGALSLSTLGMNVASAAPSEPHNAPHAGSASTVEKVVKKSLPVSASYNVKSINSAQEQERIALKKASVANGLRIQKAERDHIAAVKAKKIADAKKAAAKKAATVKAAADRAHQKRVAAIKLAEAKRVTAAKAAEARRVAAVQAEQARQANIVAQANAAAQTTPVTSSYAAPQTQAPATTRAATPSYTAPQAQASTYAAPSSAATVAPQAARTSASSTSAKIAAAALAQVGVKQDCTALVSNSLRAVGINFHGWPADYLKLGTVTNNPQPGDIIYYKNAGMGMAHVAVYIGGGKAVHGGWNGKDTVVFSANLGSGPVYIHVN